LATEIKLSKRGKRIGESENTQCSLVDDGGTYAVEQSERDTLLRVRDTLVKGKTNQVLIASLISKFELMGIKTSK
jgi:hypothetical protein